MDFIEVTTCEGYKVLINKSCIISIEPKTFSSGEGVDIELDETIWHIKEDYETVKQKIKRGDINLPPADVFTERVRKGLIP